MDPIRRQLKLLDLDQARQSSPISHILTATPLAPLAVAIIVGIVIQQHLSVPSVYPVAVLVICFIIAALAPLSNNSQHRLYILAGAATISFACIGAIRLTNFYTPAADDISNFITAPRTLATIRGKVVTDIRTEDKDDWAFGKFTWAEPATSFYLNVTEIETTAGFKPVSGKLRVQVAGPLTNIDPGDRLQLYCWLSTLTGPSNPGQFDFATYLQRRNVHLTASISSSKGVKLIAKQPDITFAALRRKLKSIASTALLDEQISDDSTAITAALILGDRSNITAKVTDAFRKTGLAHFISLSGMHIGMLAFAIWWLASRTGMGKRTRAILCMTLIASYLLVVPARAPTLRAGFICFTFCFAVIAQRKTHPINTLSLAAIILLLLQPPDLFLAGWQLSFTTVLAIMLLQNQIEIYLLDHSVYKWKFWQNSTLDNNPLLAIPKHIASYVISLISVGMAAWIGVSGILLYHFGTVTPLCSLWTVLVFPLVIAILAAGFVKMLLAAILPTLAVILGTLVSALANTLIVIVKIIAAIDITTMSFGTVAAWPVVLFYSTAIYWRFAGLRQPRLRPIILTVMTAAVVLYLAGIKYDQHRSDTLTITVLDVGHGQAIIAELPGGKTILFDAGSLTHKNPGQRVVMPFLQTIGIDTIDAVFISHDDIDHLNGIPEIAALCKIKKVYVNSGFIENTKSSSSASYLKQILGDMNIPLTHIDEFSLRSDAKVTPIWPTNEIGLEKSIGDNDKSQVTLIEYAGRKVLLTSDIETAAQQAVLDNNPDLNIDVIVMPHHGSKVNLVDSFIEKLDAETAIISCAKGRYQSAYKTKNAVKGFYTPVDGAVTIKISSDGRITTTAFK